MTNRPVFPALNCLGYWSMTQSSQDLGRKSGDPLLPHLDDRGGASRKVHDRGVHERAWLERWTATIAYGEEGWTPLSRTRLVWGAVLAVQSWPLHHGRWFRPHHFCINSLTHLLTNPSPLQTPPFPQTITSQTPSSLRSIISPKPHKHPRDRGTWVA